MLQRDKYRGNYDLKETRLVQMLCKACSLDPKQHSAAQRAVNWKQPTTKHSGDFAAVMEEVTGLHTSQLPPCQNSEEAVSRGMSCMSASKIVQTPAIPVASQFKCTPVNMRIAALQYLFIPNCGKHEDSEGERELKVGGLNGKLDELVRAEGDAKAGVLQWLIRHTSPRLMRWILRIILKDMKVPSSLLPVPSPPAEVVHVIVPGSKTSPTAEAPDRSRGSRA